MLKAIKEAANITLKKGGKPILYADYMSSTTVNFTQESTFAQRKGVNVIRWDGQRAGTMTTQMTVYDPKWIALLFGTEFASSSIDIAKREVIDVAAGGTTTKALSAVAKSGSMYIFKLDADGVTHDIEQTVDTLSTPGENKYKYDTTSKLLTFNASTFAEAGKVVVYYLTASTCNNFKVTTSSYPAGYELVMDAKMRGTDQNDTYEQLYFGNVKPQSNVTLTMDDANVGTIEITWDLMGDAAGDMMTMAEIA